MKKNRKLPPIGYLSGRKWLLTKEMANIVGNYYFNKSKEQKREKPMVVVVFLAGTYSERVFVTNMGSQIEKIEREVAEGRAEIILTQSQISNFFARQKEEGGNVKYWIENFYTIVNEGLLDRKKEYEKSQKRLEQKEETSKLEKENLSMERAKQLRNQEVYTVPKGLLNEIIDGRWEKYFESFYQGEGITNKLEDTGNKVNKGVAIFGRGIYSTPSREYAKKYGIVRKVDLTTEVPSVPLRFRNMEAFSQFEYKFCEENGISIRDIHIVGEIDEIITKMGYDGVTIGEGRYMIVVKYKNNEG